MTIFNEHFISNLKPRIVKYIRRISKYKKELENEPLFVSKFEDIEIDTISFEDCFTDRNFDDFKFYETIIVKYYVEVIDTYCNTVEDVDYEINLPSWILADDKEFEEQLDKEEDNLAAYHKKQEEIKYSSNLREMRRLAHKLGYKVEDNTLKKDSK